MRMRVYNPFGILKIPIASRFFGAGICLRSALVVANVLFAGASLAQEIGESKPLPLSEAIRLTLVSHPDLAAFGHRRQGFEGQIQQAGAGQRPQLGYTLEDALGTGQYSGIDTAQSTLSIAWVLEGEVIEARAQRARTAATQVDVEQAIRALDLAAQTARLFIANLAQQEQLKLARLAGQQADEALRLITRRVEAGKGSVVETLQTQAQLAHRQLETDEVTHQLKTSRYQLAAQWGGKAQDYRPQGDLFRLPSVGSFEQQLQKLKQSPAVQAFANQQRIAQSEIELARIEAKPRWELSAGLRRYESTDDYGLVAGISIPLGKDKGSTGRIKTLQAKQAEYEAEAETLSRRLDTQLYVLLQEIQHSQHLIETLQQQVIPRLDKAQAEAAKAYDIGQLGYLQWHAIRQEWLATQRNLLSAFEAIHLQHIELQRLTGASLTL